MSAHNISYQYKKKITRKYPKYMCNNACSYVYFFVWDSRTSSQRATEALLYIERSFTNGQADPSPHYLQML